MKKIIFIGLMMVSILLAACQVSTPPIVESPMAIPDPVEIPSTVQPAETPVESTPTETVIKSETCVPDCTDNCAKNSGKVCGQGTSYDGCVKNCGTFLRPEGCKASCNTEATEECVIVFRSECKRDCTKSCA